MTLFEYLSVAISIVLSLSVAQILANLRATFDPMNRYWVHATWVGILLFQHILTWWGFWSYRNVEEWNIFTFSLSLISPGILFVISNTLIHKESIENVGWEDHFYKNRKPFFAAFAMLPAIAVLRDWVLSDIPVLSFGHIPEFVATGLLLVGWISESRRTHEVLTPIIVVFYVTFATLIWIDPGSRVFWS